MKKGIFVHEILTFLVLLIIAPVISCAEQDPLITGAPEVQVARITPCLRCPTYSLDIFANGEVKFTGERNVKHIGVATGRIAMDMMSELRKAIEEVRRQVPADKYVAHRMADAEIIRIRLTGPSGSVRTIEFDPMLSGEPIRALSRVWRLTEDSVRPFGWIR